MSDSREKAYFEQFSGHHRRDDMYWDRWAVTQNGFVMGEFDNSSDAIAYCAELSKHPEPVVVHIEKAGYDNMRLKQLAMPIWPTKFEKLK